MLKINLSTLVKKPFFWIGFGLLALAIVSPAGYHFFKIYRAHQLISAALDEKAKGNLLTEFEMLRPAYQLAPNDLFVLKTIAEEYAQMNPSQSLPFWELVIEKENTLQNHIKYIQASINARDLNRASNALTIQLKKYPTDADLLFCLMQLLSLENDLTGALRVGQILTENPDISAPAILLYIQLTQISPSEKVRQSGIELLQKLSKRHDSIGMMALRYLAYNPKNTPEENNIIVKKLEASSIKSTKDTQLTLVIDFREGKINEADFLKKAQSFFDEKNPDYSVNFARWLNFNGLYKETLRFVSEKEALHRRDLFLIWIDALAVENQWQEIQTILQKPNLPIEPFLESIFSARAAIEFGQNERAQYEWDRAILESNKNSENLWFMVDYAQKLNMKAEEISTLKVLAQLPDQQLAASTRWLQIENLENNTQGMIKVLNDLQKDFPNNSDIQNDWAYIHLLTQTDTSKAIAIAQKNFETEPDTLSFRMTYALSLLIQEQPQEALNLFNGINLSWQNVGPRWLSLYIGILKANGAIQPADSLMQFLPQDKLLPEEKAMIEK
jgi:hypothetical protein